MISPSFSTRSGLKIFGVDIAWLRASRDSVLVWGSEDRRARPGEAVSDGLLEWPDHINHCRDQRQHGEDNASEIPGLENVVDIYVNGIRLLDDES